jgi:hypothetical protein
MIEVDIKFLKHLILILKMLLQITNGKYKTTPGDRQYRINIASRTVKQLDYLIKEASDEEAQAYLRRGLVKEAVWN